LGLKKLQQQPRISEYLEDSIIPRCTDIKYALKSDTFCIYISNKEYSK